MQGLIEKLEKQIASIMGATDELFPPAKDEELDAAELKLEITFPEDFRTLYKWRNGQKGILFLFDEFRIFSLIELLELNRINRKTMKPEYEHVTNDSGIFKDCIASSKWIQFGDNGGNTILFLDMDPGKQGTRGQILEACDGEPKCNHKSIKEFLENIVSKIESGEITWNKEAGSFWPVNE